MPVCHVVSNIASARPLRAAFVERRKLTLSTLAHRRGLNPRRQAVICQRNGRWVSQKHWRRVTAKRDDVVVFVILPGDSGTLRSVASLALVIVAAVVATAVAGPAGLALTGAMYAGAVAGITAGISIAGSLLLNVLIPVRPADGGLAASQTLSDSASPTYAFSVSSQQNVARLGGSIPVLYGRLRFIPDLAATAWWEWVNGMQTLYQTLCLSQGEVNVEKTEFGRTPVSTFEEVSTQLVAPGGTVTLFEPEVYQAPDVRGILLGPPNDLPVIDDGTYGPFAAVPPGQATNRIGLDISFPRGLFLVNGDGSVSPKTVQWKVEAQKIDDAGAPLAAWLTVATETFNSTPGYANTSAGGTFMGGGYATTDKAQSPLTVSYRYTLASSARWQIRVTRLDTKDLSARAGHDVAWAALRGFLGGGTYGNVSILAVATTATASINDQTIRQIAVTGTRKLPLWTGSEWTAPQVTRSIAAAAADIIRNSTYGGGRPDRDYDLAHLSALDATWAARGDTFDYYFSQGTTLWAAETLCLRAGRALPYQQAGMVRFHRDEPQTVPVQVFSRENIVKGTFSLGFALPSPEDEIDGIEVKYFNEVTSNFASIRKRKDGEPGDPENPASTTLEGVVQAAQADRETDYMRSADIYRRAFPKFDTELEGNIPSRGDLILVNHDMPRWGQSTRVLTWDPVSKTITLWGRPDWGDKSGTWYALLRDRKGKPSAEIQIASIDDDFTITLSQTPTYPGGNPFDMTNPTASEPLHIMVGQGTDRWRKAIFLSATPRGGSRVSIEAVLEDDRVHVN